MKHRRSVSIPGFTLVELLVVIAIIALLAAILLPVFAIVKEKARIKKARIEIAEIATGIRNYESDYGRFPVSANTFQAAAARNDDFTFGTAGVANATFNVQAQDPSGGILTYQANNSEVMAILLDNDSAAVNFRHAKNPNRKVYLPANKVSNTSSPGIGLDGVYRDPWGNPYIITIDLNNDGKARDAIYGAQSYSQLANGQSAGFDGLFNSVDPLGAGNHYECSEPVMVWSAGPDKMIDTSTNANQGANRDNILSWK
jgi:prepilin-type N-terminal cleavage/methylation domain-containing protein